MPTPAQSTDVIIDLPTATIKATAADLPTATWTATFELTLTPTIATQTATWTPAATVTKLTTSTMTDGPADLYTDSGGGCANGHSDRVLAASRHAGAAWGFEQSCTPTQYTALAQAWASHLKSTGWFTSTIVYAFDEPDDVSLPDIAQDSQRRQLGDADWKARIMDTTDPTPGDVGTLNPALGIYCVALKRYDHWNYDSGIPANDIPYGRSIWPTLFAQNIQLWFYESYAQSAPYPTFSTNTLWGAGPRLMLWGSWYESATGFLYWDTIAWHESNPWGPNVISARAATAC
ncbi:MAG: hypothetical protein HY870_08125 [Chloroflexi bacterium]|nr:hypothetical protein [Chloroflexota bacterium]